MDDSLVMESGNAPPPRCASLIWYWSDQKCPKFWPFELLENIDSGSGTAHEHERAAIVYSSRVILVGTGEIRRPLSGKVGKSPKLFVTWTAGDIRHAVPGFAGG